MATSTIQKQYANGNLITYTPSITWESGTTITVANKSFSYYRIAGAVIIAGRFNITATGSPSNTNLIISLPSGITAKSDPVSIGGFGVVWAGATISSLLPRLNSNSLKLSNGAGGGYSSAAISTGYYEIFAIVPTSNY